MMSVSSPLTFSMVCWCSTRASEPIWSRSARGLLEAQLAGGLLHPAFDLTHHFLGLAIQEAHGALHVALVLGRLDGADAGSAEQRPI